LSYDAPMMRILFATLFICALPFIAAPALAQSADAITIGTRRVVKSQVLKEDRTVYIQLPESYAKSSGYHRYPVLYVRDGGKFFQSFAGAVQHLSSDATPHVPEMIVVAIPETDRVRDSSSTRSLQGFTGKPDEGFASSGGGDNFLRFLEQELVPYIDKEFSTSSYRIYCGYSFTGLSVIDAFLDKDPLFDAFLMIDPSWWWDDYLMEKRAAAELAGRKFDRAQLFIAASGEAYPEKYFIEARDVESLAVILRKTNPAGLEWKFQRYPDESHHSMALRSLYDGLSYFFRGYQPTLRELYVEPEKLKARYQALSARLGERVALSEGLLLFFGEQFLNSFKEPDQALRYYEMAVEAYPQSEDARKALSSLRSD
jgi:predicted alpha/beta superfamily hydrolase